MSAQPPHPGFVYFIESGGFIKIGWSADWHARVRSLRTANPNPIDVLLVIKGSRQDEGDLHARFQACRAHGEWYTPTRELLDHIDLLEITGRPDK
jgi:hypothetical protein